MPFCDQLRADDNVDLPLFNQLHFAVYALSSAGHIRGEYEHAASGNNAETSSAIRSTPGPQGTRESALLHSGHLSGTGCE